MTSATAALVVSWFVSMVLGLSLVMVPLARGIDSRRYLAAVGFCLVALLPQAPLMGILAWTLASRLRLVDPPGVVFLSGLLGFVFGPASLLVGFKKLQNCEVGLLPLAAVACFGIAILIGSFLVAVLAIYI